MINRSMWDRVVFFGRPEEVTQLAKTHPELIPYLPLNVAIFSEASNTILTSRHPAVLKTFFRIRNYNRCSSAGKAMSSIF